MNFLLHHLLAESAEKFPERKAVVYRDLGITYRELEETSNRLANTLLAAGVGRGDRVGIYMPKTINSVVSVFGVLKAGGVYVPIAADAPAKRVEYIIGNCGIKHVITVNQKVGQLEKVLSGDSPLEKVVLADAGTGSGLPAGTLIAWESILNAPSAPPMPGSIDRDLAYILYTSGSTGDPKGVMISHLNSLTFVNWAHEFFQLQNEDRVANHAPLHFDLSVFDIFTAIKAGATIVIVPDGTATFPVRLAELIDREKITVWNSVPSVLVLLVSHGKMERFGFPNLRLVLFAGEKFPVRYLRQLKSLVPHAAFYNQYGQTEANSSTYYCVRELPDDGGQIPIGKAAANFEVFAIDENKRVISRTGEIGELYVNSSSVARGYWGDPEKTGLAFVENPLNGAASGKVFKTGDLVTLDEHGDYIFLSRKDHMVKSRGYRVELGEIEAVISNHPGIKKAAVVAIPDELIGNRIKAFVVPLTPHSIEGSDVAQYCSDSLPKYMVPEEVVVCNSLPMTSTGKIDRRALVSQGTGASEEHGEPVKYQE